MTRADLTRVRASHLALCLVLGLAVTGAASARAATDFSRPVLVFASFTNQANAERTARAAASMLRVPVAIEVAQVKGTRFFRVLTETGFDDPWLFEAARRAGFGNAWRTNLPAGEVLVQIDPPAAFAPFPDNFPRAAGPPPVPRSPVPVESPVESLVKSPVDAQPAPAVSGTKPVERAASERPLDPPRAPPTTILQKQEAALAGAALQAMVKLGERPRIAMPSLPHADTRVQLDGRLDDAVWKTIPAHDGMTVIDPDLLAKPRYRTLMRFFYTERGLYVGVKLEQPTETLIARLSSRDAFINRDSFGLTLDTSGEGLYGYWFTVNLGGSVMDGKVAPERNFSREWDGPWRSATQELADGWSLEMFLPWSMMSMPRAAGVRRMGFWANRKVAHLDERWSVPALPFSNPTFMSTLAEFEMQSVEPRRQLDLYPYVSSTIDEIRNDNEYRVGADLFWRPTPNLQITATINPDFGAVESDDVVVNLTAFETFFPEKRLFFLEGNEVFTTSQRSRVRPNTSTSGARRTAQNFTPEPTTLLNTRRIGGSPDVAVPDNVDVPGAELGRPTDLLGAIKLTGQIGGLRYGTLAAAEDDVRRDGVLDGGTNVALTQDGRNFGVARLLYESAGAGRRSIGYLGTAVETPAYDAYVHGVDTHWLSASGKLSWDTQLMASNVDDVWGYGGFMDINYATGTGSVHQVSIDALDDELDVSDVGFLRRNDAYGVRYSFNRQTSRGLTRLRARSMQILLSQEYNGDRRVVRTGAFFRNGFTFKNKAEVRTELNYFPARWDDRNSQGNGQFKIDDRWIGEVSFGTDSASPISISTSLGAFQEDLSGWQYRASGGVTFKPNDRFSLDLDVTYARRDGWLVYQEARDFTTFAATDWRPKLAMDFFISARQQLRLTMQWAGIRADEQDFYQVPAGDGDLVQVTKPDGADSDDFTISRLTGQLRYRWEIGPLSDLFVVYTRGANLPSRRHDEFTDLFADALDDPIVDVLVMKLRYRLGL